MRVLLIVSSVAAIIFVFIAVIFWSMFCDHATFSSGLSSYGDLPSTANNISIYKASNISGLLIMVFSIPENDFKDYAESHSWPLKEITEAQSIMSALEYHNKSGNYYKEISNGLDFEKRQENGGGVTLAYDRGRQLAYVNRSSR